MPRMSRICPVCDTVFQTYWPVVCCSMDCRDEARRRKKLLSMVDWACECDRVLRLSLKEASVRRACGMECVGKRNRDRILGSQTVERETVRCKRPECSRTFERRVTDVTWEFCSKSCRAKITWAEKNLASKMIHKKYRVDLVDGNSLIVRSRWEAAFIKDFLEKKDVRWKYEGKTFDLPDGTTYTPDFIIDEDLLIELKGYEYGPSLQKVKVMRSMGHSVVYADAEVLKRVYGLDLSDKHLKTVAEQVV